MKYIFFLFVIFITSCAVKPKASQCVDERIAQEMLKMITPMLNRMDGDSKSPFVLTKDACWKRTYTRNERQVIVYVDPVKKTTHMDTSNVKGPESEIRACLDRGLILAKSLDPELNGKILSENQKKKGHYFWDMDVGAVKWLKCSAEETPEWYESVGTMLHELNHENKTETCLFDPYGNQPLCFTDVKSLPLRSVAAFSKVPVSEKKAAEGLLQVQGLYLTDSDQPYDMLLDELLSYSTTLHNFNKTLTNFGATKLYDKDGTRAGALLPFMQILVIRYLIKVWESDRKLFEEHLLLKEKNWQNLKILMGYAEHEYQSWVKSLHKAKKPERRAEKELRAIYLQTLKEFEKKSGLKLV